ncbi:carbamoyl-phosphate synthase large subunit [Moraxella macacae 0408225]|uniref:Carbamoyl phosphate synthase large chain n=1 Tax=Moraxella macacae 0408225 TaxID=1230338 RepID=L2F7F9_9GAMM|nr:carbamoyl-phosphate synthase large subunit [Moraxella macacae]ELA08967.1 carbamoyl-phosphate synthase large subunit [Moraxella macacae 0408225]
MPKRSDIKSILIIGAGPIVIGQACEFDYSGAQACKALKEEGYRVILVNSNPATIMTDPAMADATYIEPITWQTVEQIIAKERPDAILPTMGGQTALNCALDLDKHGVLAKYDCELIGASKDAIEKAEDRELFDAAMKKIGLECPKADVASTMDEALAIQARFGFPVIIRPSFTMGGSGGGIAYNKDEFMEICERGFDLSPTHQLLIDESLIGWKEYEMEVVRDKNDNCIIICSIENFDPMGVHTGDSITVAPAQTLTDKEYQLMRNASIAVLREIGVETGGSNVQFGINPKDGRMVVIEMNPRVSRSSALASKATGFPIAKIAAKLAVGFTLDELKNDITGGKTPASFEPALDYVVTKIPRFNFEKFPKADPVLTTQMKSVGEVMAIGRNFQESLQKALRGLETGATGFDEIFTERTPNDKILSEIKARLTTPTPERIFYIAEALRFGMTVEEIFALTHIDLWFLVQIKDIIDSENWVKTLGLSDLTAEMFTQLKRKGLADLRLANLMGISEKQLRKKRWSLGVYPVYKRVDTCAGEFASDTAYMYSTYDEECESNPSERDKIMVIGGGPNRIGQGIEFDYCCVHAALAMRDDGFETIMVNCNPETVSTDYDTSDRLYFESVTLEDVLEIVRIEQPKGVIVQYGGQTPLKLARSLEDAGVPIIGTSPDAIDRAEDRERFAAMIAKLGLRQPSNALIKSASEGAAAAAKVGYPLVVRPSYVLGGRAMEIVYNEDELNRYLREAVQASDKSPVLLDHFLDDATEVDVDCVSDGNTVVIGGIMQHIEQAGVHSGDSACSIPPYSLSSKVQDEMRRQTIAMAKELGVVGLMNVQFAVKDDVIYVLEVNPRASRTVPFVSKCIGVSLAKVAARAMAGKSLTEQGFTEEIIPKHFSVKEAVFPFAKFPKVDPVLGPEMKSTGEVMGVGETFAEAYYKAIIASGDRLTGLPTDGELKTVFISVRDSDKAGVVEVAKQMAQYGFNIVATSGTHKVLSENGIVCQKVNKVTEGRPHVVDMIKNGEVHLIINTTEGKQAQEDSFAIRRNALQQKVFTASTLNSGKAICQSYKITLPFDVYKLQDC